MAKIRMTIELDYDAELMHGNAAAAIEWFFEDILIRDLLFLHSNEIGDIIGTVKIIEIDK